ncbi:hypothetical protein ACFQFG_25335 [Methylobacterium persicinum]
MNAEDLLRSSVRFARERGSAANSKEGDVRKRQWGQGETNEHDACVVAHEGVIPE